VLWVQDHCLGFCLLLSILLSGSYAINKMEAAINTAVASTTETITSVLTTNIPVVLVVFGGLVALGIALRLVKRTIGRRA